MRRDGGGCRVVEDQGRRKPHADGRGQPVAQVDGGQRFQTEPLERLLRAYLTGVLVSQHLGRLADHQVEQGFGAGGGREGGEG